MAHYDGQRNTKRKCASLPTAGEARNPPEDTCIVANECSVRRRVPAAGGGENPVIPPDPAGHFSEDGEVIKLHIYKAL